MYDILIPYMITVIEVKKNTNENNMNLVRRFTRKVQESGIIQKVKSKRYNERAESKVKTKIASAPRSVIDVCKSFSRFCLVKTIISLSLLCPSLTS